MGYLKKTSLKFVILLQVLGVLLTQGIYSQDFVTSYKLNKVVIDAGHGGHDSGAIGKDVMEKDITLAVALKLGKLIETNFPDVTVIYTRKTDVFIPLDERTAIANKAEADLFISIHVNSNPSSRPTGAETYVMGLHKSASNLDVAMRENSVITYEKDYTTKYEGYDPNSAESFIIFSLMQNAYLNQSLDFASKIQDDFCDRSQRKDRGVKQAGFLVLWKTAMPSVLVELGFLSNPQEEKFLMSDSGQNYLASSIFRAFRSYKTEMELKSNFVGEKKGEPQVSEAKPDSSLKFQIQILSSSKLLPVTAPDFKNLDSISIIKIGSTYKYTVGNKSSYAEIQEMIKDVKKTFPESFVIAVKNGVPIPIDEALKQSLSSNQPQ
ncbi:MAG TPA: N-acetylmuramoyl-L-alanine amidase [Williamwhitmania sp.]|nr:N-acetylmuramoyl-L-alanine amidase [Williamwhitmania sp.]